MAKDVEIKEDIVNSVGGGGIAMFDPKLKPAKKLSQIIGTRAERNELKRDRKNG